MDSQQVAPLSDDPAADMRAWHSINAARNLALIREGLKAAELDPDVVLPAVPSGLRGKSIGQMYRDGDMLTLDQYNQIVGLVLAQLGHVAKMQTIGQASSKINFGFDAIGALLVGLPGLGHLVSPWAAYKQINTAAAAWNVNKTVAAVRLAENKVRIASVYNSGGPLNQPVDRLADAVSLLHLIRGMNQALPSVFSGRRMAKVNYRLVQLPIVPLLLQWQAGKDVEWDGKNLVIDGKVHGRGVWLVPDHNGQYVGDFSETPQGEIQGVLLTKDVLTLNHARRDGEPEKLPVVYKGEIYQIDDFHSPFQCTIWEVEWNRTLGDTIARWLPTTRLLTGERRYQKAIVLEQLAIGHTMTAASEARRAALRGAIAQTVHPDPEFYAAVEAGRNILVKDEATVAMSLDIVGFTRWCAQQGDLVRVGEFMQPFMTAINRMVQLYHGKHNNFTGDGAMFVWMESLGPSRGRSLQDRLACAFRAALEIADLAERQGRSVRIGISVGPTVTFAIATDKSGLRALPVTIGSAMNLAARAETALKQLGFLTGSNIGVDTTQMPNPDTIPGIGDSFDLSYVGSVHVKTEAFSLSLLIPGSAGDTGELAASMSMSMTTDIVPLEVGDLDLPTK